MAMVSMLIGTSVPNANASLSTGACVIILTFQFNGPVGLLTAPSFTLSGGGGPCAMTFGDGLTGSTSIGGSGSSVLWNCGATVASATWNQTFSNGLPEGRGTAVIAGTNGAWTITVVAPPLVGTAQMTTLEPTKVATCPVEPFGTITMIGVMEFQDP